MKTKITLIFLCFCLANGIYAQTITHKDGIYHFEEAQLVIQRYDTKEVIENRILTDTTTIDGNDIHLENVILEVEIQNEKPFACKLSDRKRYKFDELMLLKPAFDDKELTEQEKKTLLEEYLFLGKGLSAHQQTMEGEKLIITFEKYNFGQSAINYTMTAKLTVVLKKLN